MRPRPVWQTPPLTFWILALLLGSGCSESNRQWSEPQQVDPNSPALLPILVPSPDGRALAAWVGYNPDRNPPFPEGLTAIYASWKVPGGSWGSPTAVDGFRAFAGSSYRPSAAAGPSREAVVVWAQSGEPMEPAEVWASRDPGNGVWGDPVMVGEASFGTRESPLVAIGPDGQAFVAWWLEARDSYVLALSELQPDGSWGAAELQPLPSRGFVSALDLSVDRTGRVVFTWQGGSDGGRNDLSVMRFTPGSGWGVPSSIADAALPIPAIVDVDPDGTVFAFGPEGGETACPSVSRNTPEGWDEATPLDPDCSAFFGGAVSADGVGGATVVWGQGFSERSVAFWSRYNPGSGWSEPQPAPVAEGSGPLRWGLSARPSGDTLAIWYRSTEVDGMFSGMAAVWTSTLDQEGGWSEPTRLSGSGPPIFRIGSVPVVPPRVVSYSDGRAVGLWGQRSVDFSDTLWSSEYR